MNPLVTVVIPTRNRPDRVCAAIRSALNQTYRNLEIVVVVDGPDSITNKCLQALEEPRLRVIELTKNVGGSEARNVGAREAKGEWIAFLDDDDTWFPEKILKQVAAASLSNSESPIVTSRLIAKRQSSSQIWPERRPKPGEPVSEYLFCRTRISARDGCIQTSTLMVKRELLLSHPFTAGLREHQEWDWLLRATEDPRVSIEWVWEPLAVWDIAGGRKTVSGTNGWRQSYYWAKSMKQITPKAFLYFLAAQLAPRISLYGDLPAIPGLLKEMIHPKGFSFNALRIFLVFLVLPTSFRRAMPRRGIGQLAETSLAAQVDGRLNLQGD
jgi:glycosyltransferase involved in cell wall biosynthesis